MIKKCWSAIIPLLFFTILFASVSAAQGPLDSDTSLLDNKPYMTFSVNGYADGDGRVTTKINRNYFNPDETEIEFADALVFLDHVTSVDVSENLDVDIFTDSGRTRVEISGLTSKKETYAIIHIDTMSSRGGWKYGQMNNAAFTFFDERYSSLPLKKFSIRYELAQTAIKTEESVLGLFYNKQGHEFSPINITSGELSSISWYSHDIKNKDELFNPEELEFVKINIQYTIPDLLRHNRYMKIFILTGFVLAGSIIYFYWKIRSLENTLKTLSTQNFNGK